MIRHPATPETVQAVNRLRTRARDVFKAGDVRRGKHLLRFALYVWRYRP